MLAARAQTFQQGFLGLQGQEHVLHDSVQLRVLSCAPGMPEACYCFAVHKHGRLAIAQTSFASTGTHKDNRTALEGKCITTNEPQLPTPSVMAALRRFG